MKTNCVYIFLSLIFLLVPNCSRIENTQTGLEVTVSLNLTGDIFVDVTHDPITKASSDDLYAVNVFRNGSTYASGLFDDVSAMNVTLLTGYKYTFTCCLIKNAKNVLYYGKSFDTEEEGYAYPFQRGTGTNTRPTQVENQFIYSSTLSGTKNGLVHLKGKKATTSNATLYASINRYYGETGDYTPVHNGVVVIDLKRVNFGVQFKVQGLKEGHLNVSMGDFIDNAIFESDGLFAGQIFTFSDPYECWDWANTHTEDEPYSFSPDLLFTYVNSGERSEFMGIWDKSKKITVTLKRNIMTTIIITVDPDLSGIVPSFTEEPLSEENEINIGVEGGALIDTGVTPNE